MGRRGRVRTFSFYFDQSKKNPAAPAANLLARNPFAGTCVSSCDTLSTYAARMDVRVWRACGPAVHVGPREKQSVPFTGNVYMDRLQSPSPLPSLPPSLVPGFRRARHFTYAARYPRANIYPAQTSRYVVGISLLGISAWVRFVVTGVPHSARLRYASPLAAQRARPRHLIEKPHAKWTLYRDRAFLRCSKYRPRPKIHTHTHTGKATPANYQYGKYRISRPTNVLLIRVASFV